MITRYRNDEINPGNDNIILLLIITDIFQCLGSLVTPDRNLLLHPLSASNIKSTPRMSETPTSHHVKTGDENSKRKRVHSLTPYPVVSLLSVTTLPLIALVTVTFRSDNSQLHILNSSTWNSFIQTATS